jgi:hypothetical protein
MQPPRKLGRNKEGQHHGPLAPSHTHHQHDDLGQREAGQATANRNHRSATRRAVKRDTDSDATVLPILRGASDEWAMAKDGRSWFGRDIPKLMRK